MNVSDILNGFTAEASDFIKNPDRLDGLLAEAEEKLRAIPRIGETVSGLPVLISMVKSWIKKEYEVQPKVLVTIVAALLYLLKGKDLISDKIPVIGMTPIHMPMFSNTWNRNMAITPMIIREPKRSRV